MDELWERVRSGKHTAVLGLSAADPPPTLRVVRVRCDVPPSTLGPAPRGTAEGRAPARQPPAAPRSGATIAWSPGWRRPPLGDVPARRTRMPWSKRGTVRQSLVGWTHGLIFEAVDAADEAAGHAAPHHRAPGLAQAAAGAGVPHHRARGDGRRAGQHPPAPRRRGLRAPRPDRRGLTVRGRPAGLPLAASRRAARAARRRHRGLGLRGRPGRRAARDGRLRRARSRAARRRRGRARRRLRRGALPPAGAAARRAARIRCFRP